MNTIGRIFIFLNLVLAVTFLAWSATYLGSARDDEARLADLQAAYRVDLAATVAELRASTGKLEGSLASTRRRLEGLEVEKLRLELDLSADHLKTAALSSSVVEINLALDRYAATIDGLSALIETLRRERAAESDKQDALEDLTRANEMRTVANMRILSLEAELNTARKTVSTLKAQLALTGERGCMLIDLPVIDGTVLDVHHAMAPGLVNIDKGSDDGVMRGFTFDVYLGSQYKGTVRVENVQPHLCTCVVVKTYAGRKIDPGDSASTRI